MRAMVDDPHTRKRSLGSKVRVKQTDGQTVAIALPPAVGKNCTSKLHRISGAKTKLKMAFQRSTKRRVAVEDSSTYVQGVSADFSRVRLSASCTIVGLTIRDGQRRQ